MNLQETNSNELYDSISPEVTQELRNHERHATIGAGARLVAHGDAPKDLIIVNAGCVEISVSSGDRTIPLVKAGSGKVIGLRSIVGDVSSEVDVKTLGECEVTLIPRDQFLEVLNRHPEIYLTIARILSTDLKAAEYRLRDLRSTNGKEGQRSLLPV